MGKRKSKKRKNKLARPPKRGKSQFPPLPPLDLYEDESGFGAATELTDLDAPTAPLIPQPENRPFGAVHPSLYGSRRYQKFRDKVAAIRDSLPDSVTAFATYDVPDLKDRQWLRIYAVKKEAGELPEWQQVILEKAGFNWVHGRPPRPKPQKRPKRRYEEKWQKNYRALADACSEAGTPLLGLLYCEDALYGWLHRQIKRAEAGQLKPERLQQLEALPFDFKLIANDPGFGKWRASFKAYATNNMNHPERWARTQTRTRQAGKLPQWRIEALDAIQFDWEAFQKPNISSQEAKEDRWREKLDRYLELEAAYTGSGPHPLNSDKSMRPWATRMRQYYREGALRPEIIREFEARGFEFDAKQKLERHWRANYEKLRAFKERFGHVRLPSSYVDDPDLGQWLGHQKERMRKGKLKGEKRELLEKLGVVPLERDRGESYRKNQLSAWLKAFREIEAILKREHGGQLPRLARFSEKHHSWLRRQQTKLKKGDLEPWQLEHLASIGFDPEWIPRAPSDYRGPDGKGLPRGIPVRSLWPERIERLRRFVAKHGHAKVPRGYPDRELVSFVETVRTRYRKGKLNESELAELRELDFIFFPHMEITPAWKREYEALRAFHAKHGHSHVPRSYPENQPLAEFVAQQRQRGRKGLLLAEHIRLLDALGFKWSGGPPVPKEARHKHQ
ncbi:MAG: helicase associated domain-containing protein [Opitutales bacterium]